MKLVHTSATEGKKFTNFIFEQLQVETVTTEVGGAR